MISDSYSWKLRLERDAKSVQRRAQKFALRKTRGDMSESLGMQIETFVFTSAFIVRKLKESSKLSDELESKALPLRIYRRLKRRKWIPQDQHPINMEYSFRRPGTKDVSLKMLCDRIIHSHTFIIGSNERNEILLTFNSDKTRDELCEMRLDAFISFVQSVAADEIVRTTWRKKSISSDLEVVTKSRNPR